MAFPLSPLFGQAGIKDLKLLVPSIAADANAHLNGLAFRVQAGVPVLYAADGSGNESSVRTFNVDDQTEIEKFAVGTFAYGVAVGQGDFDPEIFVSPTEGRILRKKGDAFENAMYPPMPLYGIASAAPRTNYGDLWAVADNRTDVVRFHPTSTPQIEQKISDIGNDLTDVAVDTLGNIYVVGGSTVYKYDDSGKLMAKFNVPAEIGIAIGITVDERDDSLWLSSGGAYLFHVGVGQ